MEDEKPGITSQILVTSPSGRSRWELKNIEHTANVNK